MARYNQFCALARAAEIIGERWTLLIVRELLLGPKRFTDFLARLHGISTSVLTERLSRLEDAGLVSRSYLEPPAASTVYELTDAGLALRPAVFQLIRWGARFLMPRRPGEQFEPDWLRLALTAYARREPSPALSFQIRVPHGQKLAVIRASGGPDGTSLSADESPADVAITADGETVLSLMGGRLRAQDALDRSLIQVEGDVAALERFPELFSAAPGEETEM